MRVDRVDTLNTHQRVWNFLVITRWLAINFYNQTPAPSVSRGLLLLLLFEPGYPARAALN